MKLLLGSNSPRRLDLLQGLGFEFEKVKINCNEDFFGVESRDVAKFLAEKKSNAYRDLKANEILITADTVVLVNNFILNKPDNEQNAKEMLGLLSNKAHQVITGVCIRSFSKVISFDNVTEVRFDTLSLSEMDYYISGCKPYDKAGSYGIQEWIGLSKVLGISGCYYNVMGLPTSAVYKCLTQEFGVHPKGL
ncbi:MAG: septum formation protein Maf [Bacteroidota bacterium]|jgi:septum formation protein